MDINFLVDDMSCDHCKARITKAVENIEGVKKIKIDLKKKTVLVSGSVEPATVQSAIESEGYHPKAV